MVRRLFCLVVLFICLLLFPNCQGGEERTNLDQVVEYCWAYAQNHPDGFTLCISDYNVPVEGIVVSYEETQNQFGIEGVRYAVTHASAHSQIVGGWLNPKDQRYYFDSDTIFNEDSLADAIEWAKHNYQSCVFVLSSQQTIFMSSKYLPSVSRRIN